MDDFLVWDRSTDLPSADWDLLVDTGDLVLSRRWLGVVEQLVGAPMRYLLLRRNGEPAAALVTVLADRHAPWVSGRIDYLLARGVQYGSPSVLELLERLGGTAEHLMPTLLCGGRQSGPSRVLHRSSLGPARREDVELIVGRAEQLARELKAGSVSFPFVDERDVALRMVLADRGYLSFSTGPYHWMRVAGSFASYLGRLSPKQRSNIRRERRRIREAGIEVAIEQIAAGMIPRLAELEARNMAKYGTEWDPARSASELTAINAALGEDAKAVVARAGGQIRGFAQLLRCNDQWYFRQKGFDYAFQANLPLYFEVFFYHPVERAPELGIATIHYGLGSDGAKRSRGCVSAEQRCFLLPTGTAKDAGRLWAETEALAN